MSGKRDSNPRPSAWEADALPTELFPQREMSHSRDSNPRPTIYETVALPAELKWLFKWHKSIFFYPITMCSMPKNIIICHFFSLHEYVLTMGDANNEKTHRVHVV